MVFTASASSISGKSFYLRPSFKQGIWHLASRYLEKPVMCTFVFLPFPCAAAAHPQTENSVSKLPSVFHIKRVKHILLHISFS